MTSPPARAHGTKHPARESRWHGTRSPLAVPNRTWTFAPLLALLAGCAPYVPGSLVTAPDGRRYSNTLSVGCVDLSVNIACNRETSAGAVIVVVDFGNRCDVGTPMDFTRLAVFEGDPGCSTPMVPFDPRAEIAPGRITPHGRAIERVEFARSTPGVEPPARVCVRAMAMLDASSRDVMCFESPHPGADGWTCPTRFVPVMAR